MSAELDAARSLLREVDDERLELKARFKTLRKIVGHILIHLKNAEEEKKKAASA